MHLQAQSPLGVFKAIAYDQAGVVIIFGTMHRLQEEILEVQSLESFRLSPRLGAY